MKNNKQKAQPVVLTDEEVKFYYELWNGGKSSYTMKSLAAIARCSPSQMSKKINNYEDALLRSLDTKKKLSDSFVPTVGDLGKFREQQMVMQKKFFSATDVLDFAMGRGNVNIV